MSYLLVGFGGIVGAMLRYGLIHTFNNTSFAYGTLLANSIGSLLVGIFFIIIDAKIVLSEEYRLALIVGFCGSLTTLSTISIDTINLFNSGSYYLSFINVFTNLALSFIFVILGSYFAKIFL